MIHVDIISDTVCPWCYIGKRRLEAAMARRPGMDFQLGWRPYQLNPELPPGGLPRERHIALKFGGAGRGEQIQQTIKEAGLDEGLAFRFDLIERQPRTFDSHRLIHWAASADCQGDVVESLFEHYFMAGRDIGDRAVLVEIAGACGMDRALVEELFEKDADRDLVMAEEAVARRMGISGVPCFIVDRKFAVSGAQDPSVIVQVFDLALNDQRQSVTTGAARGNHLPEGASAAD
jgi:predicted DsbA family dithiol-disulfide isomerase